jgi:hypothetical protein
MSATPTAHEGRCHCGAIGYTLRTMKPPAQWTIRACQCSFCRSHGARTTADPAAAVTLHLTEPSRLIRYRFASQSLEFLLCGACGCYIGAMHTSARGRFATLNVNVMQPPPQVQPALPFVPDDTPLADKQAGREKRWTPVMP